MAVEESASEAPTATEASGPSPAARPRAVSAMAVTSTCAPPRPNTSLRIAHSRGPESSSPIRKRRKTTPSSAICPTPSCSGIASMSSGMPKTLSARETTPNGPTIIPATR